MNCRWLKPLAVIFLKHFQNEWSRLSKHALDFQTGFLVFYLIKRKSSKTSFRQSKKQKFTQSICNSNKKSTVLDYSAYLPFINTSGDKH